MQPPPIQPRPTTTKKSFEDDILSSQTIKPPVPLRRPLQSEGSGHRKVEPVSSPTSALTDSKIYSASASSLSRPNNSASLTFVESLDPNIRNNASGRTSLKPNSRSSQGIISNIVSSVQGDI
jgi:hypothetical protein